METTNQINYTIGDKKYILFEVEGSALVVKIFIENAKKFDGVAQSVVLKKNFWNGRTANVKYLIPEDKAIAFSRCK